jgi:hypothetical protein
VRLSLSQTWVADANAALLGLAIVGLFVRGGARRCWSFAVYLLAALVANRLVTWWPETFWHLWFYSLKESVYTVLRGAVAAEIGSATFTSVPTSRRRLALWLLVAAAGGAALDVVDAHRDRFGPLPLAQFLHPIGQIGTLWMFAVVALFATRESVPIAPLRRWIMLGFALYLLSSGFVQASLRLIEPDAVTALYMAADPIAYAASVGLWAIAAWRAERHEPSAQLRRLQAWTA